MKKQYHEALFQEEGKSRFICTVLKENFKEECYVASSSKLSRYLPLKNCEVLLSENKGNKLRTRYTLEAVNYKNVLYYVNFNRINQLFEQYLSNHLIAMGNIYRECIVDNIIKTDFIVDKYGCIEVKALLSSSDKIVYPDNGYNRIETQLFKYIELLKRGKNVTFAFVTMSPTILIFEWNAKKEALKLLFREAILLGLKIRAFSVIHENNEFRIIENIILEKSILESISF